MLAKELEMCAAALTFNAHSIQKQMEQVVNTMKIQLEEINVCEKDTEEALQRKCEYELFITAIHDEINACETEWMKKECEEELKGLLEDIKHEEELLERLTQVRTLQEETKKHLMRLFAKLRIEMRQVQKRQHLLVAATLRYAMVKNQPFMKKLM